MPAFAPDHDLLQSLLAWLEGNHGLAIALVFLLGFAESIVLIAVFVPSSVLLAGIGTSYSAIGGSLEALWLAATFGAIGGDAASFAIGRYFRNDVPRIWPFRRYPRLLDHSRYIFHRWGWFAFVLGKFAFGIRPFVPVTAGVVAMPIYAFVAASLASSVLWAAAALGLGYAIGEAVQRLF